MSQPPSPLSVARSVLNLMTRRPTVHRQHLHLRRDNRPPPPASCSTSHSLPPNHCDKPAQTQCSRLETTKSFHRWTVLAPNQPATEAVTSSHSYLPDLASKPPFTTPEYTHTFTPTSRPRSIHAHHAAQHFSPTAQARRGSYAGTRTST
jgi:hypothetical protein